MTTVTHARSTHVDAPVEAVFAHVAEPTNFFAALPPNHQVTMADVDRDPDGLVTSYAWSADLWLFEFRVVLTREEYVPGERIVDHSSAGPVFAWTFEPDEGGTTLSLAFSISSRAPFIAEFRDAVILRFGDEEVDTMLERVRHAVEQPGPGSAPGAGHHRASVGDS